MRYVYVVVGTAGEYDDKYTWNVAAHKTRKRAERHRKLAEQCADKIHAALMWDRQSAERDNPFDPNMPTAPYIPGPTYYVDRLPFEPRLD